MGELIPESLYTLYNEHHYVLDQLDQGKGYYFLTGKAGTGKSTLIQTFRRLTEKKVVYLAPTGVAAIQIGGQTIHSFFKFPAGWIQKKDYKLLKGKWLESLDWIVIDEISMVRADLMDHIDQLLRESKKIDKPFGGIPMFWIGDLFQLPPVVKTAEEKRYFSEYYASPYFFSSHVFNELDSFEYIELSKVFRQKEARFLNLLNKIRLNELDWDELEELNQGWLQPISQHKDEFTITLTTTNMAAQKINLEQLERLPGQAKRYSAKITGLVSPNQYPGEEILILKEGAQVMLLRNDPNKRFVNGSLAKIISLQDDWIEVQLEGQTEAIRIEAIDWEILKYRLEEKQPGGLVTEVVGRFIQYPLRLAWAVTIHKSQGKTFDNIVIDLGHGAFEAGQAYVALSRCRTKEGIRLVKPLQLSDVHTDERVVEFLYRYR